MIAAGRQGRGTLQWTSVRVGRRRAEVAQAIWGDRVTVAFVHGFASTPRRADRRALEHLAQLPALREGGARLLAPELPGFGGSEPLDGRFTLADYANWYVACLEEMDVRPPVVLFGESLGGAIAALVAARRSDLVDSLLVLNSVGGVIPDRNRAHWLAGVVRMGLPRRGAVGQWISSIGDAGLVLRHPRAMWRLSTLVTRADLSEDLRQVAKARTPALAVFSKQDPVVLEGSSETFRRMLGIEPMYITGDHRTFIDAHPAIELLLGDMVEAAIRDIHLGQSPAERLGADLLTKHGIETMVQEADGSMHPPGGA